jgi:hypothetical protein
MRKRMMDCALAGLAVRHLDLSVHFLREALRLQPAPLRGSLLPWAMAMSSGNVCAHLESLFVRFHPVLANERLNAQRRTLDGLVVAMPHLTRVVLGSPDIEWRRCVAGPSDSPSVLPEWTPRPDYIGLEVLEWWMNALGLRVLETTEEDDLERIAIRLRDVMCTRWDNAFVPPTETLQTRLFCS